MVLSGLQWIDCLVYLDDIIIFGKDFDEHLERLCKVFSRLREYDLTLKPSKCMFLQTQVTYLGHVVSKQGIAPDPEKVEKLKRFTFPKTIKSLRRFLVLASYFRKFIKDYSNIAACLYSLLKGNVSPGTKIKETEELLNCFNLLKDALTSAPVLRFADFNSRFYVKPDASDKALGLVLTQKDENDDEYVILYASKMLHGAELRYSVTEKEYLGIVWAVTKVCRHYLAGREFTVVTDHNPLKWVRKIKAPGNSTLLRWTMKLQEFDFNVVYKTGKLHCDADFFSRLLGEEDIDDVVSLVTDVSKLSVYVNDILAISEIELNVNTMIEEQRKDKFLSQCTQHLQFNNGSRKIRENCKGFEIIDNLLYKVNYSPLPNRCTKQLLVPETLKCAVLKLCHDTKFSGHGGFEITYNRLKSKFFWFGMYSDTKNFVKSCEICQINRSKLGKSKGKMLSIVPVGRLFNMIACDVIGPLPTTERGNKYVVTFMDVDTKWPEAYPTSVNDTDATSDLLVRKIVTRFGVPEHYLTDLGSNYASEIAKKVYKLLGLKKENTSPFHAQTDGMLEKYNGSLIKTVKKFVNEYHDDWDLQLDYALFAYRTAVHKSTNETPYFLLYGRDPKLPMDELYSDTNSTQGIDQWLMALRESRKLANELNKEALVKSKKYYDEKRVDISFKVGDKVWLHRPKKSLPGLVKGSKKFMPKWEGPYRIVKRIGELNYILSGENGVELKNPVHVDRLKSYTLRFKHLKDLDAETNDLSDLEEEEDSDSELVDPVQEWDKTYKYDSESESCSDGDIVDDGNCSICPL